MSFHISVLFLIYLPIALAGYFAFGGEANSNIVLSISDGPIRVTVEVMLLLHLVCKYKLKVEACNICGQSLKMDISKHIRLLFIGKCWIEKSINGSLSSLSDRVKDQKDYWFYSGRYMKANPRIILSINNKLICIADEVMLLLNLESKSHLNPETYNICNIFFKANGRKLTSLL